MAQYYTDFRNEYIGNGAPSGWFVRINAGTGTFSKIRDTSNPSGKSFRITGGTNGSKVVSYNAADGANDVETLVKFRVNGMDTGRQGIALHRYSGTSEASTAGWALQFLPASSVKSLLISNDQSGATHNFANYNWSANTVYWARFRTVGTSIQARVWPDGSAEPGTWLLDSVDSTFMGGAGTYNGVGSFTANANGVDFMEYAVATGGDTAVRDLPNPPLFANGYMYRKKVVAQTSQLTTSTLSNQVLVVDTTDPDLKAVPAGGKIYNEEINGKLDVLFTDSSGTALASKNEIYNNGTGRLLAWLKMPSLGNSASTEADRTVYMYYGKPVMTTSNEAPATVWSAYQFAVLMNGGGSGTEANMTQADWWAAQGTDDGVTGKLGLGRSLTAGNIYKNAETKYNLAQNNVLSVWVKFKALPPSGTFIAWPLYQSAYGAAGQHNGAFRLDRAAGGQMSLNQVKYGIVDQNVNWTPSTNVWYHITTVQSTTAITYYVNGVSIGSFSNSSQYNWTGTLDNQITIGRPDGGASQARPNADVDYMYKYSGTRSADQILTDYRNQNAPSTFWGFGTEETSYTTVDKDQVGNVRISRTNDNTQTGNVRVRTTNDKAQSGNVRITATTDRTQVGNVRIRTTNDKTQIGNVRIRRTIDNTQVGNVRIRTTNDRNQIGNVRIGEPPVDKPQVGNVSIQKNTDRTQIGNVRIRRTNDNSQIGNVRIRRTNDKAQIGNVRITATTLRTQVGNVAIEKPLIKDQVGNVRISRTNDKAQTGNVRIATKYDKAQVGNVRITATLYRDQIGNVRVYIRNDKDQVGNVTVARTELHTQVGNVRIVKGIAYDDKPIVDSFLDKPNSNIKRDVINADIRRETVRVEVSNLRPRITSSRDKPIIR
jgi:hypothetical protein